MPYWIHFLILLIIAYVIISIAIYYLQDYLLFKPEKLPEDFQFHWLASLPNFDPFEDKGKQYFSFCRRISLNGIIL